MPVLPTSLDELAAVNIMLEVIGESPISSFSDETVDDIATARNILKQTLHEILEQGWHVNTDEKFVLAPDINDEITLPLNVARIDIDPSYQYDYPDVVQRGSRLYNRDDHTYTFTDPLKVTIIWYLGFDEVDPAMKRYATIRAARKFQQGILGSQELAGFTERDELEAKARLLENESDVADLNFINEYTAARMLRRNIG